MLVSYDQMKKLKSLDGELFKFLEHLSHINELTESPVMAKTRDYALIGEHLRQIVREAREAEYNWVFSDDDIEINKTDIRLPSVELAGYLLEDGNNNKLPDFVFSAFNELISANLKGKTSTVLQKDVVDLIVKNNPSITGDDVYKNGWLDVEQHYKNAGWSVYYDKPAYCETWYEPRFVFSEK